MQNRVLRVSLATTALLAVLLLGGAGGGIAAADPAEPGDPDTTSEPPTGTQPESTSAAPTATPTPEVPRTIFGALQDLLNRPFSIFGNGRVPGDPPTSVVTGPDGITSTTIRGRSRDKPATKPDPAEQKPEPAPVTPDPNATVPQPKWTSSVDVVLPFAPPVSIPLPPVPVPGYENLRLTLDLSNPYTALASVQETTNTINSLLVDAYAPYNPFKPPAPEPRPTFKILEEEPVVEAGGGTATPVAGSSGDLPVMVAPAMAPPIQIALPRPITLPRPVAGTAPAEVRPSAGTADVRSPVPPGSTTPAGSSASGPQAAKTSTTVALGRPAPREGYQQYLRSARSAQVATVAVPGLIGLLALTASGVVTGYRQANSQRFVRAEAARFLP